VARSRGLAAASGRHNACGSVRLHRALSTGAVLA
jgi:hypothetical protein